VRFFAICCFAIAAFYGWTAVDAMRTGTVRSLGGKDDTVQRRDDPNSKFQRWMLARWMYAGGFAALGGVMLVFAGRFDKLGDDARK
jgi:hypothetical protein